MLRMRLAAVLVMAAVLPWFAAGDAIAGGGFLPGIPPNFEFHASKDFTVTLTLDPNGPIGSPLSPPDTPTGGFGTITIVRKGHQHPSATAVFQVVPFSTLGDLVYGCNLLRTDLRFVLFGSSQPGQPLGGPGTAGNWLPTATTISLFSQLDVALLDPTDPLHVLLIPGISEVTSQACAPFPSSYPDLSFKSGGTPDTTWTPGFLLLEGKLGFWAAPGTKVPK